MLKSDLNPEWTLEVQTNFNVDPKTNKTSATYLKLPKLHGFINAIIMWCKRDQQFAGLTMEEFVDSLLTPEELALFDGMPVATFTHNEIT